MWILRRFSKDGFSAQFLTQRFSRSFSKDFPPIFRNVEVWLVQKFQINFSIFTHFMRNFGSMSHNGKRLCDVAPKNFLFFYFYQNYKIFWQVLLKTFRAILQNRCCVMCLFDFPCFWSFFEIFLEVFVIFKRKFT